MCNRYPATNVNEPIAARGHTAGHRRAAAAVAEGLPRCQYYKLMQLQLQLPQQTRAFKGRVARWHLAALWQP
jgi:hypothetical protein